jgi:AcrR family transcriptional regulator
MNIMSKELQLPDSKPTRADALQNRELLLETAQQLFDEQGVDEVTMAAIAQAAGVGKGTLYRHFENKGALCQALLDEDQRKLQERTLHHLRQHDDPLDNLRWFLLEVARFVEANQSLLCVHSGEGAALMLVHPAHLWWRQTIRELLTRLDIPGDHDYAADTLYLMVDVHTIYFQQTHLGYDFDRIRDGLIETLLKLIN